jgi:hypothetical protein
MFWAIAVATALGLAGGVRAGDDTSDDADGKPASKQQQPPTFRWSPWVQHMIDSPGPGGPLAAAKPAAPSTKPSSLDKKPEKKKTLPAKPVVDEAAAERAREESALLRRLEVCDKLMEIAVRTNDNDLMRKAEDLDRRARTAYSQHTAHLNASVVISRGNGKSRNTPGAQAARSDKPAAYSVSSAVPVDRTVKED